MERKSVNTFVDLALLIGSYYNDIKCVIAIVPSHVAFPGNTTHFSTSAWRFKGEELAFVPVNEESVPALMKRDLRTAFEAMLKDSVAEQKALINVERIDRKSTRNSSHLDLSRMPSSA